MMRIDKNDRGFNLYLFNLKKQLKGLTEEGKELLKEIEKERTKLLTSLEKGRTKKIVNDVDGFTWLINFYICELTHIATTCDAVKKYQDDLYRVLCSLRLGVDGEDENGNPYPVKGDREHLKGLLLNLNL